MLREVENLGGIHPEKAWRYDAAELSHGKAMNYDPRDDYKQSAVIAFVCGAIVGFLSGTISVLMIEQFLNK
jgi:hypothetical protein